MIYHTHRTARARGAYGGRSFADLRETVRDAVKTLTPVRGEFDAIAVTGVSGLVVGAPLALELDAPLLVLRKPSDDSHDPADSWANESDLSSSLRVLFVDDFVSGGDTQERVRKHVEEWRMKFVGRYTYREDEYLRYGSEFRLDPIPLADIPF